MARNLPDKPSRNEALTLTTYAFTATAADDTISATGVEVLETGREVYITVTGGTAQGLTTATTYYVIANATNKCKVATTYANAIAGTAVDITGDAGAGVIYPVYDCKGGFLFVGTGTELSLRGLHNVGRNKGGTGTSNGTPDDSDAFVLHRNVANGTLWPFRLGQIHSFCSAGTCASNLVLWY